MRFDPCPGVLTPPPAGTPCQPVVRLVFQSLSSAGAQTQARDGAIHAFYRVANEDWAAVVAELRAIRGDDSSTEVPLDVHPRLLAEGPSGAYGTRLEALVKRVASTDTLVRVTQFRHVDHAFFRWEFSLRERGANDAWTASSIATTGQKRQTLTTVVGGRWDAIIHPAVTHADNVTQVFSLASSEEMKLAMVPVARVLNPRVHSSESIDCATCHIAPDVSGFLRATQKLSVADLPERFQSTYGTAAATKSDEAIVAFDNIHMLSYVGRSLSITARVANETAAVLEVMNAR